MQWNKLETSHPNAFVMVSDDAFGVKRHPKIYKVREQSWSQHRAVGYGTERPLVNGPLLRQCRASRVSYSLLCLLFLYVSCSLVL